MVTYEKLEQRLKNIGFNPHGWGKGEVRELCDILGEDEEIEECVNGYYEAGFALLVATKNRVLLVDKKPLSYLTVEDLRFDMITEFDYSHRLFGAHVCISSSTKTFNFTSSNKIRLRRLIMFVQNHMSQIKKTQQTQMENQQRHLEEMNEQLRQYLAAAKLQAQSLQPTQYQAPAMLPEPQPQHLHIDSPATFEQVAAKVMGKPAGDGASPRAIGIGSNIVQFMMQVPRHSQQVLHQAGHMVVTPQQVGLSAVRRVVPVISAYSRLPLMSNRRRFYSNQSRAAGAA